MKHIFIVNPAAGNGKSLEYAKLIEAFCVENTLNYQIIVTDSIDDTTEKAREQADCNEYQKIYSVGGDGTLNEVLNGIADTNSILGIIPGGTGNDFYKTLINGKNKKQLFDPKDHIEDNIINTTTIDYGQVNDRAFLNIISFGMDAEIAQKFLVSAKKSQLTYYKYLISTILAYEAVPMKVSSSEYTTEQKISILAICNGKYYGNGIPIAPKAKIDDRLFDVYLADKVSVFKRIKVLLDLFKGKHDQDPHMHYFKTDNILVEGNNLICNIDGEITRGEKFKISLMTNKMSIVKPNIKVKK